MKDSMSVSGLVLFIIGLVLTLIGSIKGGEPPQRPNTVQRPPIRQFNDEHTLAFKWVNNVSVTQPSQVKAVSKPASKSVGEACCSPACTCGCNDGGECVCRSVKAPTVVNQSPQYVPQMLYSLPTATYSPSVYQTGTLPLSLPGVTPLSGSFGGFRSFSVGSCSSGG